MPPILIFLLFIVVLFLLSRAMSAQLGMLLLRLSGMEEIAVKVLAFIFLPGTVVHEFSHAFVAQMTGVYVGDMSLMPRVEGDRIKLGTVQIAQTDPFRRFFIGVAPFVVGFVLILMTLKIYQIFLADFPWWAVIVIYYIIFQIGNGMFSSRRDLEGALELFVIFALVFGVLYFFGVKLPVLSIYNFIAGNGQELFKLGIDAILKIVVLDAVVVVLAYGANRLLKHR